MPANTKTERKCLDAATQEANGDLFSIMEKELVSSAPLKISHQLYGSSVQVSFSLKGPDCH